MYIYMCVYIGIHLYIYIYMYISIGLCTYVRGVGIFAFVRAGCHILVAPACKGAVGNSKSPP